WPVEILGSPAYNGKRVGRAIGGVFQAASPLAVPESARMAQGIRAFVLSAWTATDCPENCT
ncbi:MAG: hypothetical protein N2439_05400, partial [Anaerolineae bacterium]|nr:hypothetical protein [Anaerolineae bacterium]